jgi:hypothetical protein
LTLEGKDNRWHESSRPKEATQISYDVKYIGMDVHKEAVVIAILNGGKIVMESIIETKASSFPSSLSADDALCRGQPPSSESGRCTAMVADSLLQPQDLVDSWNQLGTNCFRRPTRRLLIAGLDWRASYITE